MDRDSAPTAAWRPSLTLFLLALLILTASLPAACGAEEEASAPTATPSSLTSPSPQVPAESPAVVGTIAVGSKPWDVAVNPNTNRLYAANEASNDVSVIDEASGSVLATIGVGQGPSSLAVNPETNRI